MSLEAQPSQSGPPALANARAAALMRLAAHRGLALLVAVVLSLVLFGGVILFLGLPVVLLIRAQHTPPPATSPADPAKP